jgi:hypothetical protein
MRELLPLEPMFRSVNSRLQLAPCSLSFFRTNVFAAIRCAQEDLAYPVPSGASWRIRRIHVGSVFYQSLDFVPAAISLLRLGVENGDFSNEIGVGLTRRHRRARNNTSDCATKPRFERHEVIQLFAAHSADSRIAVTLGIRENLDK